MKLLSYIFLYFNNSIITVNTVGIKDELENYVNVLRNEIKMIFHKENPTKVYVRYIPCDLDKIKVIITYYKGIPDTFLYY